MLKTICIALVRGYRFILSPFLGGQCRFHPSCSEYAEQCFDQLPFCSAVYYISRRLLSCHPFGRSGFDPVPKRSLNIRSLDV